MRDQDLSKHSAPREGLVVGLAGGLISALWLLAMGLLAGDPLQVPNVLGQVFFDDGRVLPEVVRSGAVLGYLAAHFAFFIALGILLTIVAHLASRTAAIRMGVLLGGVIGLGWLTYHMAMLPPMTEYAVSFWVLFVGAMLGIASVALLVWRQHAALRHSFRKVEIGDAESRNPPAAPGGLNV